jgi:hypothetical protein
MSLSPCWSIIVCLITEKGPHSLGFWTHSTLVRFVRTGPNVFLNTCIIDVFSTLSDRTTLISLAPSPQYDGPSCSFVKESKIWLNSGPDSWLRWLTDPMEFNRFFVDTWSPTLCKMLDLHHQFSLHFTKKNLKLHESSLYEKNNEVIYFTKTLLHLV